MIPRLISLILFSALHAGAAGHSRGKLGAGTTWETDWHVIDSGEPGPTVLIVGGIHGNEPAGFYAAEQIRHWPIAKGKLVVIPQVNRLGLDKNTRWAPEHRKDRLQRDLNRNFPTQKRAAARTPICREIWAFISGHRPDWVFDLHEGFDFHRKNPRSVGSSVIAFPEELGFAQTMVDAVNRGLSGERRFDLLAGSKPVYGSLVRACTEQLGAKSFILETTYKHQPISTRTRQQRRMVSTALLEIGLIAEDCSDQLAPRKNSDNVRLAIFDGPGTVVTKVLPALEQQSRVVPCHVGAADMRAAVLEQFDLIVFPGGSGSKQGIALGEARREQVRDFVREGGGVIGICAGAYLCSSHYKWSLDLFNASVLSRNVDIPGEGKRSLWFRGPATEVDVKIEPGGKAVLGISQPVSINYENGPIFSPGQDADAPDYRVLATFLSENGLYEAQKNTMIGAPAVVESEFGAGRVLAISPHFESTPGLRSVISRAVDHVRRRRSSSK